MKKRLSVVALWVAASFIVVLGIVVAMPLAPICGVYYLVTGKTFSPYFLLDVSDKLADKAKEMAN